MKQILLVLFVLLSLNSAQAQISTPAFGRIERLENFPSKLLAARNVDVWLPEGYSAKKKYAVLYMHDGQMLFDGTHSWNKQEWGVDETVTQLMKSGKIKNCIVVGVWNTGATRHADYFPQRPFEALPAAFRDSLLTKVKRNKETALFATNVQSDAYLKFLVTELKPYIDSHFSTKKDRKNTFIAGSSMGGLISMYAICEYPEVFGGAACISTHWPGIIPMDNNPVPATFVQYLKEKLPDPRHHKIYFDYGTATLDAHYEPTQLQVDVVMKAKGFGPKNWITKKFEGADHSEKAWRERLDVPLVFLMGK